MSSTFSVYCCSKYPKIRMTNSSEYKINWFCSSMMTLAWRCKTSLCGLWQILRHGREHDFVTVKGDVVLSRNAVFIHSLLYISSFAVLVCLRYKARVLHVVNTTGTHNLIIVDSAGSPSSIPVRQDWDRCEHAGIALSHPHTLILLGLGSPLGLCFQINHLIFSQVDNLIFVFLVFFFFFFPETRHGGADDMGAAYDNTE